MDKATIQKRYKQIMFNVGNKKLVPALNVLSLLLSEIQDNELKERYEQSRKNYQYLLEYTVKGIEDPQRQNIYNKLIKSLLEIADKAKHDLEQKFSPQYAGHGLHSMHELSLFQLEDTVAVLEKLARNTSAGTIDFSIFPIEVSKNSDENRLRILGLMFEKIYMINRLTENEQNQFNDICISEEINWYEKCVIVSALTMSLIRFFDIEKFNLLFEFYNSKDHQIWQRALVGLITGMYIHNKRMMFYPELFMKFELHKSESSFYKDIESITLQFIKSTQTERIAKKIRDEIIPEVAKITPKLTDKLDLENIVSGDISDDKNPAWEKFIEDSGDLYKKMEELTKMQMEGSDIFMGTFSMLKNFPFFREISNWFLPFFHDNRRLVRSLKGQQEYFDIQKFLEAIQSNPFMCNSDKYSFSFNIQNLPGAQKSMLMKLMTEELSAMGEMASEEDRLNKNQSSKYIFTQYIQDLYRFCKLYQNKHLFHDIFSEKLDIFNSVLYERVVDNSAEIKRKSAEYYFDKERYENALDIYLSLVDDGTSDFELIQKTAFCYQKLKDYKTALKYYLRAELFDKNKVWNMKKIAFCYQRLKQTDKALKYYYEVEKLKPEDLHVQVNIGKCFLDKKDYEKALQYFFKVEYLSPSNIKVLRPISWCSFVTGKFDQAEKYLKKVIKIEGNKHDFINLGHVEYCRGNRHEAVGNYLLSIKQKDNSLKEFMKEYEQDKEILLSHGISADELPLILDFVMLRLKTEA